MKSFNLAVAFAAAVSFLIPSLPARAAEGAEGHGHSPSFGMPGKAADVKRTITVVMRDIAFSPENIAVAPGETVRFIVRNEGTLLHEFNIGTPTSHIGHQKEMTEMMNMGMLTPTGIDAEKMKMDHAGMSSMKHDDPNTVLLEPGKTQELIWKFGHAMALDFACNIPGHYQAGMVGSFRFAK